MQDKQPDLSKALKLSEPDSSSFSALEAVARLSEDEQEFLRLGHLSPQRVGLILGMLHLHSRSVFHRVDVAKLIWQEQALSMSENGRGIEALVDMTISNRNRQTDERSGWGRFLGVGSKDSSGRVQQ